jgi:hypothetical protein
MAYIRGLLEAAWSYRCLGQCFINALQHLSPWQRDGFGQGRMEPRRQDWVVRQ